MDSPNAPPVNPQLVDYAAQSLKHGVPEETIQKALRLNQLSDEVITNTIAAAREQMQAGPKPNKDKDREDDAAAPADRPVVGASFLPQDEDIQLHAAPSPEPEKSEVPSPDPATTPAQTPDTPAAARIDIPPGSPLPMASISPDGTSTTPMQPYGGAAPTVQAWAGPVSQPIMPAIGGAAAPGVSPYALAGTAAGTPPASQAVPSSLELSGQYTFRRAITDFLRAATHNFAGFFAGLLLSSFVAGGLITLATIAVSRWFSLTFNFILLRPDHLAKVLFGSMACYLVVWALSAAALASFVAPALVTKRSGRHRSVGNGLALGFGRIVRAAGTAVTVTAIIGIPAGLVVAVPAIVLVASHQTQVVSYLIPILYAVAAIWTVNRASRLAMAPLVSVFERLGPGTAMQRSRDLLQGGNRLIILAIGGAGSVALAAVALTTGYSAQRIATLLRWPLLVTIAVTAVAATGILSVIYDIESKRRRL